MAAKYVLAATLLMTQPASVAAQKPAASTPIAEPIRYSVSFPVPHTHYVEVTATVPTLRRREVELMMAVWTPGSYLVREFERNVEGVSASAVDGSPLTVMKSDKNRWRVTTNGAPTVSV